MDPNSGQIVHVDSDEEARAKGLMPLSEQDVAELEDLTPSQRVAWARRRQREQFQEQLDVLCTTHPAKLEDRNARKRRRRRSRKGK